MSLTFEGMGPVPDGAENFRMDSAATQPVPEAPKVTSLAELKNLGKQEIQRTTETAGSRLEQRMQKLRQNAGSLIDRARGLKERVAASVSQKAAKGAQFGKAALGAASDALAIGVAATTRPEGRQFVAEQVQQGVRQGAETVNNAIDTASERFTNFNEMLENGAEAIVNKIESGVNSTIEKTTNTVNEIHGKARERANNTINTTMNRAATAIAKVKDAVLQRQLQALMDKNIQLMQQMDRNADKMNALMGVRSQTTGQLRQLGLAAA